MGDEELTQGFQATLDAAVDSEEIEVFKISLGPALFGMLAAKIDFPMLTYCGIPVDRDYALTPYGYFIHRRKRNADRSK